MPVETGSFVAMNLAAQSTPKKTLVDTHLTSEYSVNTFVETSNSISFVINIFLNNGNPFCLGVVAKNAGNLVHAQWHGCFVAVVEVIETAVVLGNCPTQ